MTPRLVGCTKCRAPLPPPFYNTARLERCPQCKARSMVEVFAAALRPPRAGLVGEAVLIEGEASCFYHPSKKAVVPCANCGRFLCAVCDVELNGEHRCPGCLEAGKRKGQLKELENRRTRYDNIALALALYPILFIWTSLLGAPAALYVSLRYWNSPGSLVRRSRWRFVLAMTLALLEIAGWVIGIYAIRRSRS